MASSAVRTNTTGNQLISLKILWRISEPIPEDGLEFVKNVELKSNARRFETLNALRGMISTIATYDRL